VDSLKVELFLVGFIDLKHCYSILRIISQFKELWVTLLFDVGDVAFQVLVPVLRSDGTIIVVFTHVMPCQGRWFDGFLAWS
jgi:hypothetical protein